MSRKPPPEIDHASVLEYWQLVRAALVKAGLSRTRVAKVAAAYRKYMKPAGWAIYNRDPEDSAVYALKYAKWQEKERS